MPLLLKSEEKKGNRFYVGIRNIVVISFKCLLSLLLLLSLQIESASPLLESGSSGVAQSVFEEGMRTGEARSSSDKIYTASSLDTHSLA